MWMRGDVWGKHDAQQQKGYWHLLWGEDPLQGKQGRGGIEEYVLTPGSAFAPSEVRA